jgi:hypothetical protein
MRYLNKIIFINSASVKYAEIGLDGNVHLIGTQGVGKSTLLRAILFFYNADKKKLGIPIQKRRFDDYYFEYQNSYIIYEVVKDNIPFCVLAYKVNGRVAFRFFNSEYKRALFIGENGAAKNWDNIKRAFGTTIYYTKIISSYEEYKKILYGDNKGLKAEFRKYALIESKQYQNIPRTIQNVLLNSNLEAKFIKDTIINSISEDEFKIDVSNYAKNHLRDFETQINDIKIWFKEDKKGQITIQNKAKTIIDNYRILNFLKREKEALTINLSGRINYIENTKPNLLVNFSNEKRILEKLSKEKDDLKNLHKNREQEIISKIDSLKEKLSESGLKLEKYNSQNIGLIIEKVAKKDILISEEKAKTDEKQLITSDFADIRQKYSALILQNQNQKGQFENEKNAEINRAESKFGDEKSAFDELYKGLISKIKVTNQAEKEKAENELKLLIENENSLKGDRLELEYKTFFNAEIKKCRDEAIQFNKEISKSEAVVTNAKSETNIIHKEWALENKEIARNTEIEIDKERAKLQSYLDKVLSIQNKLKQRKSSFYGWLNDTVPNWENTIGKVVDEENVLFNTNLNPKQLNKNNSTFFGIALNLDAIDKRVKMPEEYRQEIEQLENKITDIKKVISILLENKDGSLKNLKIKFRKKLNTLQDAISENDYIQQQNKGKLQDNKIILEEWDAKASTEKSNAIKKIEVDLENLLIQKKKADNNLESIKAVIKREIVKKDKAKEAEIKKIKALKDEAVKRIADIISKNNASSKDKEKKLKKQQNSELDNKGADTKRLNIIDTRLKEISGALIFIKNNEVLVIEYQKDKRELFDKAPQFESEKSSLKSEKITLIGEQKIEQEKLNSRLNQQNKEVETIKSKINVFEKDVEKFNQFEKSDTFLSIQSNFKTENNEGDYSKTAISIIEELNDKHYKIIDKFKNLQQSTNSFIDNFSEHNVFNFKIRLNSDNDFINFAIKLKEFIEEDKIGEFKKRVNERFAHIIQLIGDETTAIQSKEAEIEKIIKKINNDCASKNFVEAIKKMEIRTQKSSNPVVRLLIQIKEFNDENSLILGKINLFTSSETNNKNNKAVELLEQLVKELEKYKPSHLTLSESFDLQFRIVENDNDSGWVEKLSNVGSEGTDVLVKAMINILLLNVFKNSASKKFQDFKLHCMMDEIGRLHPSNIKGILRFANERNILLINGSPISQNATDYKYTYKLSKKQSKTGSKEYVTQITQLVKKL